LGKRGGGQKGLARHVSVAIRGQTLVLRFGTDTREIGPRKHFTTLNHHRTNLQEGKGVVLERRGRRVQETGSIGKFDGHISVSSATGAEIGRIGSEQRRV
jgi:hypothetical protein